MEDYMKTDRGYIVAMYNYNKSICVISLEMWDLIENIDEYTPLYRTDSKKDAYNYIYELSSNIQKEPTMVNKQYFIKKACKILDSMLYMKDCGDYDCVASYCNNVEDFINKFKEYMEE
jgi:hypothetical protein